MSEPFIGEIRMTGFNYPPQYWALCDGQILPINQNQALFALLGTAYGGNGTTTFCLPDMRGRVPVHMGPSNQIGNAFGLEAVTLTDTQLPSHNHQLSGTTVNGDKYVGAETECFATSTDADDPIYKLPADLVAMHPNTIEPSSGNRQPHNNMQPSLVVSFSIALQGVFPSRN